MRHGGGAAGDIQVRTLLCPFQGKIKSGKAGEVTDGGHSVFSRSASDNQYGLMMVMDNLNYLLLTYRDLDEALCFGGKKEPPTNRGRS